MPAEIPLPRDEELDEETRATLAARYGNRQASELIVCCAYFNMLSRFLESTRVPLEAENLLGDRTPERVAAEAAKRGAS